MTNLDKLHITEAAMKRIQKNLALDTEDIFAWCRQHIADPETITKTQMRWNVRGNGFVIMIDAHRLEIMTARPEKQKKGSNLSDVNIVKKLDDIPELKQELITVFDTKTHRNVSKYGLLLGEHILNLASMPTDETLQLCATVNQRWQSG